MRMRMHMHAHNVRVRVYARVHARLGSLPSSNSKPLTPAWPKVDGHQMVQACPVVFPHGMRWHATPCHDFPSLVLWCGMVRCLLCYYLCSDTHARELLHVSAIGDLHTKIAELHEREYWNGGSMLGYTVQCGAEQCSAVWCGAESVGRPG